MLFVLLSIFRLFLVNSKVAFSKACSYVESRKTFYLHDSSLARSLYLTRQFAYDSLGLSSHKSFIAIMAVYNHSFFETDMDFRSRS